MYRGFYVGLDIAGQVRSRSRSVCNFHDNAGHAREKFAGNFGKKVGSGVRVIFEEICRFVCRKNLRGSFRCYGKRCMV